MLSLAELDIVRSLVPIVGSYDGGAFGVICYPWQKSRLPILHQVTTVHCTCLGTLLVLYNPCPSTNCKRRKFLKSSILNLSSVSLSVRLCVCPSHFFTKTTISYISAKNKDNATKPSGYDPWTQGRPRPPSLLSGSLPTSSKYHPS